MEKNKKEKTNLLDKKWFENETNIYKLKHICGIRLRKKNFRFEIAPPRECYHENVCKKRKWVYYLLG
jgi:hypothetical protein